MFFFFFFQEIQTEIVLMIFLRLAEDVITMDSNLQSSRKKEITGELNRLAQELFVFFLETLSTNISKYRVLKVGCKKACIFTLIPGIPGSLGSSSPWRGN